MYNEFAENITKESDPVRQKHYTTKKHWLVDFINIFYLFWNFFCSNSRYPISAQMQPVFLCVDDTMVSKFGTKFENVSKLFDHAAHNGSNYLNGHCFVSVMLCVPVWNGDKVSYLSVPLGYRMWQKKESKLELAASMIRQVMPEFHSKDHVIILCDSWYTK